MLKKALPLVVLVMLTFTLTRSGEEESSDALYRQLLDLMSERQRLSVVFGDDHPKVTDLDAKIKTQKEAFKSGNALRRIPDLKSIDDAQLKKILLDLSERVVLLEEEVQELKLAKPRIDLLRY